MQDKIFNGIWGGTHRFQNTILYLQLIDTLYNVRDCKIYTGLCLPYFCRYTGDSIAAVLITAFLFAFPSQLPCLVKGK